MSLFGLSSGSSATDVLIFRATPAGDHHYVNWNGPWPPPSRMAVVMQGDHDHVGTVTEPEHVTAEWLQAMRGTTLCVHWYQLVRASEMPHPAAPGEHWFRGAEYEPERLAPPGGRSPECFQADSSG